MWISKAISGWDCPLLAFIYPGFDCGSVVLNSKIQLKTRVVLPTFWVNPLSSWVV